MQATKPTHVRYLILLMLFLVTTINYADRATIAIAGSSLQKDLGIDAVTLGYIFSAFGWAYVAGQIPGGWLLDRFGSKKVYALSIFTCHCSPCCKAMSVSSVSPLLWLRCLCCASWWVWPKRPRFLEMRVLLRRGFLRRNAALRRRSSTRPSISPRCCSRR